MSDHEVIIARYNEDISWVAHIPDEFDVIIYNKGQKLDPKVNNRADRIVTLRNVGRESDTFLTHILQKTHHTDGYTVFLQGDPFEHSPDIEALLRNRDTWKDLQPLSWRWLATEERPPRSLLDCEREEFIGNARVRSENFSLTTWQPLQFFDAGSRWLDDTYRSVHGLPAGINIAQDFLKRCAWDELATASGGAMIGRFSYGGLFAVRQSMLATLPHRSLDLARRASHEHSVYGYVIERLWLHMLGEPFLGYAKRPDEVHRYETSIAGFAPMQKNTKPALVNRVAPAIKRRLLDWAMT